MGDTSNAGMTSLAFCNIRAQKRMATTTIHRADSVALVAMIVVGDGVAIAMLTPYALSIFERLGVNLIAVNRPGHLYSFEILLRGVNHRDGRPVYRSDVKSPAHASPSKLRILLLMVRW